MLLLLLLLLFLGVATADRVGHQKPSVNIDRVTQTGMVPMNNIGILHGKHVETSRPICNLKCTTPLEKPNMDPENQWFIEENSL